MIDWSLLFAGAAITAGGYFWRRRVVKKLRDEIAPGKKQLRPRKLATITMVIGAYLFATRVLNIVFGAAEKEDLHVSLFAERVELFGLNLSTTIINTWIVMAILILAALILRLTVVRKMKIQPGTAQNALEFAVEWVVNYVHSKAHGLGEGLSAYIFTIAAFLLGCAFLELFGLHTPAADITMTFAMALITFILINFYGFRKKGLKGRIKALSSPTPVILPIKLLTDIALPVSMSVRLFGNMLAGMIVVDLIYSSLGNYAVGIPSTVGLYFNVFHPLIQAFIFVTLTLTFINEAIE